MNIQCLLYADDLVVFAESKKGLQECLDPLNLYCHKWALQVNVSKTKCMVINRTEEVNASFGTTILDSVPSFKYLGIEFSDTGDVNVTMKDLSKRALKAYFSLVRSLRQAPI